MSSTPSLHEEEEEQDRTSSSMESIPSLRSCSSSNSDSEITMDDDPSQKLLDHILLSSNDNKDDSLSTQDELDHSPPRVVHFGSVTVHEHTLILGQPHDNDNTMFPDTSRSILQNNDEEWMMITGCRINSCDHVQEATGPLLALGTCVGHAVYDSLQHYQEHCCQATQQQQQRKRRRNKQAQSMSTTSRRLRPLSLEERLVRLMDAGVSMQEIQEHLRGKRTTMTTTKPKQELLQTDDNNNNNKETPSSSSPKQQHSVLLGLGRRRMRRMRRLGGGADDNETPTAAAVSV